MIRHILKLAWNRKRSNALIMIEIFATFLVVFVVVAAGAQLLRNSLRPLGFEYRDVWDVKIDMPHQNDDEWSPGENETFRRLLEEAKSTEGVVAAAGAFRVPYDTSSSEGVWDHPKGGSVSLAFDEVTDDFREVLGLTLTRGRWFEAADSALGWEPLVADEDFVRAWFGDEDPLGKPIPLHGDEGPQARIVGVVRDFRKGGELASNGNFLFIRTNLDSAKERPPRNLVLKVRPGLDASAEQALVARLQSIARDWSFELRRLEQMRETSFRIRLAPLVAGGIVGLFLLVMAGLGLLGVLWQNVTRRTREIGLRRAMGATRRRIGRQILLEVLLTSTLAVALGVILVMQVPLLSLVPFLDAGVLALGILISAGVIVLLTLACGLYPGLLAARVLPAEALHQE